MSDHEKLEHIGQMVEDFSHLKIQLNHANEVLNKANAEYQLAGITFQNLRIVEDKLICPPLPQTGNQQKVLNHLLSSAELVQVLRERERITVELRGVADRLRAVAPHLM
jgi:hypothetical protein